MSHTSLTLSSRPGDAASEVSIVTDADELSLATLLPVNTLAQVTTMFRDPYVLEKHERVELIEQLRHAVALEPSIVELRVILGMALCTNFEAQTALEELREATLMAPDNFFARLKLGEMLMRLRICTQAAEQTHIAAQLACHPIQSEMARKQASAIRTMLREGVERGGHSSPGFVVSVIERLQRLLFSPSAASNDQSPATLNPR
ncbi:MAG TPA: hypothetical protein VII58_04775 [Acidobacteriaceae bacterium]